MKKLTAQWVRKAESDYAVADQLARGAEPHHDEVCFHAQQSAEKYLKALLEELSQPVPRTHILEDLIALLLPYYTSLRSLRRGARFLTRFAVATRYPGTDASKRQAGAALRWAKRVRLACRVLLGLPPRPLRRKQSP
jgi:HEPN domain-containing protein